MRLIPILLLAVLLLMPLPIHAGSDDLTPVGVGAKMIANGIDLTIIRMADSLMDWVCGSGDEPAQGGDGNNTTATEKPTPSVTDMIIGFTTWQVTPFEYPTIIKYMGFSLCVAAVILIGYVLGGMGYAALANATDKKYSTMKYLMNTNDGGDKALSDYGKNIIGGCAAVSFVVFGIYFTLLLSQTLKLMIMGSIANSISPSLESIPVLYLAMAIMWVCVSIFFGMSNVVVLLSAAGSFILGALYTSDKTRHITTWWANYFIGMVFMQVFVIMFVAIVVGAIADIKVSKWAILFPPFVEFSIYIALIAGVFMGCLIIVIGKAKFSKGAKNVVKLVV